MRLCVLDANDVPVETPQVILVASCRTFWLGFGSGLVALTGHALKVFGLVLHAAHVALPAACGLLELVSKAEQGRRRAAGGGKRGQGGGCCCGRA